MDLINDELSVILKRGKPSTNEIDNSIIGRSGFQSWKAMIETDVARGGLGWNISGWNAYRRAYRIVQQHSYLRETDLSASMISTLSREISEFPHSLDELSEYIEEREKQQEYRQKNSLKNASQTISQLQAEIVRLKKKIVSQSDLERLNNDLNNELQSFQITHEKLQSHCKDLKAKLEKLHQELNSYKKMSFINKLKFLFS